MAGSAVPASTMTVSVRIHLPLEFVVERMGNLGFVMNHQKDGRIRKHFQIPEVIRAFDVTRVRWDASAFGVCNEGRGALGLFPKAPL